MQKADPFHHFCGQSYGTQATVLTASAGAVGTTVWALAKKKWVEHTLFQQRILKFALIPAAIFFTGFFVYHAGSFLYQKYSDWRTDGAIKSDVEALAKDIKGKKVADALKAVKKYTQDNVGGVFKADIVIKGGQTHLLVKRTDENGQPVAEVVTVELPKGVYEAHLAAEEKAKKAALIAQLRGLSLVKDNKAKGACEELKNFIATVLDPEHLIVEPHGNSGKYELVLLSGKDEFHREEISHAVYKEVVKIKKTPGRLWGVHEEVVDGVLRSMALPPKANA